MIENIKISIVIPVYNCEDKLNRCIESVLNQSYCNFEIIIVDDGSIDNSYNICLKLQEKDTRIRLFHQKNKGASAARNYGLSKVEGDYVMFIDADDFIEFDMLITFIDAVKETNADYIMTSFYIDKYGVDGKFISTKHALIRERLITSNDQIPGSIIDLIESERINAPWGKLIKSSIIKEFNLKMPEHIILQEDLFFNIKVLSYVNVILVIDKPKYHYTIGSQESLTSRYFEKKFEMTDEVYNAIYDFYDLRCNDDTLLSRVKYIYIKNVYAGIINLFHPKCSLNRKEKMQYIRNIISSDKFNLIVNSAHKSGIKYKVLAAVLKVKSVNLLYYFSRLLFILKFHIGLKY